MNAPKVGSKDAEKSPFEKVVIQRDVKKILKSLLREKNELYCKGENDVFFGFRPDTLNSDFSVSGKIVVLDAKPGADERVVINFGVGLEKYFTVASFQGDGGRGTLRIDQALYRLERREHMRIPLVHGIEKSCNIIQCQDKAVFIGTEIIDISQGGVRLTVPRENQRPLEAGQILKIVLHIKEKWQIEMMAEVRHIGEAGAGQVLGLKFIIKNESDFKRILSLTMDLQREYVRSENEV